MGADRRARNVIRRGKGIFRQLLSMLLGPGEDFEQLENTRCEFGYLFWIEEHGLEALFKITTDKRECYFAAQKESLMRLNFNEELFRSTAETFLSMHQ